VLRDDAADTLQSEFFSLNPLTSLPIADAYVFDIDGTLLVTRDLVHWNALHHAMMEAYGVDTTIEGIPYHGMTDLSILRAALAREGIRDGAFEAALPKALEVVCREVEANSTKIKPQVCPGIPALLAKLSAQERFLGVASGNLETVGWHKIETAGLRKYFAFGYYSDRCETRAGIFQSAVEHVRRELGPSAKTCFVGDTPADVRAAREIGAQIVAVASGTFGIDELRACGPDLCIRHCEELLR
jgi:phosphoglycolate phosphatase-like HAD superfamily hydrolase